MKACVIGLGYIGLPTAAVFAREGHDVLGVDVSEYVVSTLNEGRIHIEETGLEELVKSVVERGKLRASTTPEEADVFIIAVPTPIHEDYTANIDYVLAATRSILPYVKKGNVVIIESTIPPRTITDFVAPIFEKEGINPISDIHLAHCPERVLPGKILEELVHNTRIVGGLTEEASQKAADVYRLVVKGQVLQTDVTTAEMAKLMENTYRDVNIALANELSKISQKLGVNAHEVIKLANHHPRVNIHLPGPGVGGHCLAIDPYFIVEKAPEEARIIQLSREINRSMPDFVVNQVKLLLSEIKSPKLAVLGITYKGNIDDFRESPALEIIQKLQEVKKFSIYIHDPHVQQEDINLTLSTFEESLLDAHLALVLTDHNEFKAIDPGKIRKLMKTNVIFDTKDCIDLAEEDITVYKIGDLNKIKPINL